jgi:shikimate dehydrogenase
MISGTTGLIGLIGRPVNHSLSPVMHNAALAAMNLDWCYLAMPCETKDLATVLKALDAINCLGLNVTIPHKQSVVELCKALSPLAQQLGAVNTLVPHPEGGWTGDNTDVSGFLAPLQAGDRSWLGAHAVVLGCGGSARAVVAGLQQLNLAQITVVGRRADALQTFLTTLKSHQANATSTETSTVLQGILQNDSNQLKELGQADLVINTTPVGMAPSGEASNATKPPQQMPLGEENWQNLNPKTTLYDLIYTPRPTAWLQLGNQQGCQCIDGLEMLVQQGAASLRQWSSNSQVPVDEMRKAAQAWLNT